MTIKNLTLERIYPVELTAGNKKIYDEMCMSVAKLGWTSRFNTESENNHFSLDREENNDIILNRKDRTLKLMSEPASKIFGIKWPLTIGINN